MSPSEVINSADRQSTCSRVIQISLLVALILSGGAFGVSRGQDVNFDQLNYHTYSGFAFMFHRWDYDVAPAQVLHSYFNPAIYVPFFALSSNFGPWVASFVLGAAQAITLWLAALTALRIRPPATTVQTLLLVAAAMVISTASPMALSEVGTSFADTLSCIPALLGVLLLIRRQESAPSILLAAGTMVGAAAGLKLTNGTFATALVCAAMVGWPSLPARLRSGALTAAGVAIGFILTGGYWCFVLGTRFQNPVFPYYNGIFRSPDSSPTSFVDRRYLPSGVLDGALYPFRWAVGIVPSAEIGFRDIRFGIIIILLLVTMAALLRRPTGDRQAARTDRSGSLRLVVFFSVSFALWLTLFAIQRYIVCLELLSGPVAIVLLGWRLRGWLRVAASGMFALCALLTVRVPDWGHASWMKGDYGIQVPAALMDDGLFFLAGQPVSYVAPAFARSARFVGMIDFDEMQAGKATTFTRRIQQSLAGAAEKKIRIVAVRPLSSTIRSMVGSYGIELGDACSSLAGFSLTGAILVCELRRGGGSGPLAVTLEPDVALKFGAEAVGFAALLGEWEQNWHLPDTSADLGRGYRPAVFVRVAESFGDSALLLHIDYEKPPSQFDDFPLAVIANGSPVEGRSKAAEGGTGLSHFEGCVPAGVIGADRLLTVAFDVLAKSGGEPADPSSRHFKLRAVSASSSQASACP